MADEPNRITDGLLASDSNTRRFHVGNHPQAGLPAEMTEEETAALDAHRASIHTATPRPMFRDEDGNAIDVPDAGLVITDPATGAVAPLEVDDDGKPVPPTKRERERSARASRAESDRELRRPGARGTE